MWYERRNSTCNSACNGACTRTAVGGFTLIEIMVALAVAAIGLVALSKAMTSSVEVAYQLELKTIANMAASNRMAELRLNRRFSTSGSNSSYQKMAGQNWRIVDSYFGTADPNISRVVVEVYNEDLEKIVTSNIGFLARYKPPKR